MIWLISSAHGALTSGFSSWSSRTPARLTSHRFERPGAPYVSTEGQCPATAGRTSSVRYRNPNRCADAAERDAEMVAGYEPDAAEAEYVDGCRLGFHYSTRCPPQITPSDRHCQLLFLIPAQRLDRWSVDRQTLYIEHRAVTWAIPASFKTVPVQVATYVGAHRRV
jgi:hypothetical protein